MMFHAHESTHALSAIREIKETSQWTGLAATALRAPAHGAYTEDTKPRPDQLRQKRKNSDH